MFPALPGLRSSLAVVAASLPLVFKAAGAAWVLSANENKLDLATGSQRILPNAAPDTLTLLDFAVFPPRTRHLTNVSNTVLGPPSNVTFSPDGRHALVADSIELDSSRTNGWRPARHIHILDLQIDPPTITSTTDTGPQPSGIAFAPDGRHVAVANRADGTVSSFTFANGQLRHVEDLRIADAAAEVSDVACSPDGRSVVASINKASVLAVLRWNGDRLVDTLRRISVYGRPYRVRFTPDGRFLLTSGAGAGNGDDIDALTIIQVEGDRFRTTQFLPLASGPESFELSPDGRLGVAVLMNGSNTAPDGPLYRDHGLIVLFGRDGDRWVHRQTLPTGRIPEGVVFTPDGRHVVVQCHPDRELRVYRVSGSRLKETSVRIPVPGMPSGMGAGPR